MLAFEQGGLMFSNPNEYDYSPSWMVDGSTEKVWWCSLRSSGSGDDIKYNSRTVGGAWGTPQTVMVADVAWEGVHT